MSLNAAQQKAVNILDGPALVVAGAGTGKTRVIVERVAKLIQKNQIDPSHILALTFTEKAAQEMLDRTSEILDNSYGTELNFFTFNAFGQDTLSEFALDAGLSGNLNLIGETGKVVLLREHIDELKLDYFSPLSVPDGQLKTIVEYISKLKQQLINPADFIKFAANLPSSDEESKLEKQKYQELAGVYQTYSDLMRKAGLIDYDDQIYLLVDLLEKKPNVKRQLQDHYQYILVDEFQDTNPMQSQILNLITSKDQNLMTVGDDDQSIYGWRGATLKNILDFTKIYPKAQEVTLVENYRSSQAILDNAYKLIQFNNPNRLEVIGKLNKRLHANHSTNEPVVVKRFDYFAAELSWVANDIKRRTTSNPDQTIAVLTRQNSNATKIHEILDFYDVEHSFTGQSTDMYQQPIISNMVEALKATVDPLDSQALYHTLGGPLFNQAKEVLGLASANASRQNMSLWDVLNELDDETITKSLATITQWRQKVHELSVAQLSYKMLEQTGLKDELYKTAENSEDSALVVKTLGVWFESLREFQKVSSLASSLSYLSNYESLKSAGELINDDSQLLESGIPAVTTVHKAKGLEWDVVYIIDCVQNSFPLKNFSKSSLQIPESLIQGSTGDSHANEERRLMYVAITRAKNELIMTFSNKKSSETIRKPSQFLIEMFDDIDTLNELPNSDLQKQSNLELFGESEPSDRQKLPLPTSMRAGDDLVLSVSQIAEYIRCPLNFYYLYVLHIPQEPNPTAAIGTIFHSLIQNINSARIKERPVPELKAQLSELEQNWPKQGFQSKLQSSKALKLAKTSLENTYERLTGGPIPLFSELPIKFKVPETNLIVKGRIDAILTDDDGVNIVDYKTSTSATTPDKAKSKASASKQLDLYALAWLVLRGELAKHVSLDFVQTDQIGSLAKQLKTLKNLQTKLGEIEKQLRSGEYPLGYDHSYCLHPEII